MKKYVIHLKVAYYEPKKKEKKNDVEIAKKGLESSAKKAFALAIGSYSKTQEIVLLKEECNDQSYGIPVYVELKEDKLDDLINVLRKIDVVDIIEPVWEPWPAIKELKKKDIKRFTK